MRYYVEPKSREDLRRLAFSIREVLHLENELFLPIVELLDIFEETLPGFSYEVIEDQKLPKGQHAETNIETGVIRIKESVYEGARRGNGRDRMTIAHEFAHFITLSFVGFKLYRSFGEAPKEAYFDAEWQAKCLAGELMIPHHLVDDMTAQKVVEECGVSISAARYQLSKK